VNLEFKNIFINSEQCQYVDWLPFCVRMCLECKHSEGGLKTHREALERRPFILKDAVPVSVRAELFTSYPLTMFKLWNLLP